jgi:hypothetical protein
MRPRSDHKGSHIKITLGYGDVDPKGPADVFTSCVYSKKPEQPIHQQYPSSIEARIEDSARGVGSHIFYAMPFTNSFNDAYSAQKRNRLFPKQFPLQFAGFSEQLHSNIQDIVGSRMTELQSSDEQQRQLKIHRNLNAVVTGIFAICAYALSPYLTPHT